MLRTVTPKPNTPTANLYVYGKSGKKKVINDTLAWIKGKSITSSSSADSPYYERASYLRRSSFWRCATTAENV